MRLGNKQLVFFGMAFMLMIFGLTSIGFGQIKNSTDGKVKVKKVEIRSQKDINSESEGNALEYVKMVTSKGDIIIELNREKAPITVKNFLDYVDENSYDSTIFHRVISNFMIQGGGFNADMTKRPTKPEIKNEWGNDLQNLRGTIAMARRGGNIHSASNQFFINVKDNRNLDMKQSDGAGYAVFGKVIEGLDVVDIIKAVKTHRQAGHGDVPVEPVLILDVVRIEKP